MRVLISIGFFILFSQAALAVNVSTLSSSDTLIFDLDNNKKADLLLAWKDDTLIHQYINQKNQKVNLSVKNIGRITIKEYSTLINNKWKLYRRKTLKAHRGSYHEKVVETFDPYQRKVSFLSSIQEEKLSITPMNLEDLIQPDSPELEQLDYSKEELSVLITITGDCHTLPIYQQGQKSFDLLEDVIKGSFKEVEIENFIQVKGCQDTCQDEEMKCLTKEQKKDLCQFNLESYLLRSIRSKLECLSKLNPDLAAEMAGMIFFNKVKSKDPGNCFYKNGSEFETSGCNKLKLTCSDPKIMGRAHGKSTTTCEEIWPDVKVARVSCFKGNLLGPASVAQTFFHEMIHLLGYRHGEDPEMAYSCTLACGSMLDVGAKDLNSFDNKIVNRQNIASATEAAKDICSNSSFDYKKDLEKVMHAYDKTYLIDLYNSFGFRPETFKSTEEVFERVLVDAYTPESLELPICTQAYPQKGKARCKDYGGENMLRWYTNTLTGSRPSLLANIIMFGDQKSSVYKEITSLLTSESMPKRFSEKAIKKYGSSNGYLIAGDNNLIKDLQDAGELMKKNRTTDFIKKIDFIRRSMLHTPTMRYFTPKGVGTGLNLKFQFQIDVAMKDYCIQYFDETRSDPEVVKICQKAFER